MSSIGISLSGMSAASQQIANSANNLANINTVSSVSPDGTRREAFQPSNIMQSSIKPTGGVQTELRTRDVPTVPRYMPDNPAADENGMVDAPNVSADEEVANMLIASYDYKANLKAMEIADNIMQSLLNIKV